MLHFGHAYVFGGARSWGRTFSTFDPPGVKSGGAASCTAPRIAEAAITPGRLSAMARRAQRLPASAIPEHHLVATMRIDVVDDTGRADQIVTFAFHAKRMIVQEGGALRPPPLRAVERTGNRIAMAGIVLVALTLLAPANRTMDRRADGHGADLDHGDGGAGNNNARDGSSPSQAPLSRA